MLSFRQHIGKTKAKVATRNNILVKLAPTHNGIHQQLCFEQQHLPCATVPQSMHSQCGKDHVIHTSSMPPSMTFSRCITGCLKPTNIDELYCLAGIAPPAIRCSITSQVECHYKATDPRHILYGETRHTTGRLHSRHSCLAIVESLPLTSAEAERPTLW